jgi:hypothetical protein
MPAAQGKALKACHLLLAKRQAAIIHLGRFLRLALPIWRGNFGAFSGFDTD